MINVVLLLQSLSSYFYGNCFNTVHSLVMPLGTLQPSLVTRVIGGTCLLFIIFELMMDQNHTDSFTYSP